MNDQIIKDDVSRLELGRVHVLSATGPVNAAEWYREIEEVRRGAVIDVFTWKDEVGMWHMYMVWRGGWMKGDGRLVSLSSGQEEGV